MQDEDFAGELRVDYAVVRSVICKINCKIKKKITDIFLRVITIIILCNDHVIN